MSLTIDLPINQLVYTHFADVGFHLLTSGSVPLEIQQVFLKQVVYRYWQDEEQKSSSFRAIYLLQISTQQWLFGWLYNDILNELGQSYIPYFICYYLAEPLYAFRIEKVFACLQKGPMEVIDRRSISVSLQPLILKDLSLYREARPGVLISWEIRQQIYRDIDQGNVINIFFSVKQDQKVVELDKQVQLQKLVVNDESIHNNSFQPIIPVNQDQKVVELDKQVQPQKLVVNDESIHNNSLLIDKKVILLIGMGFGAITIILVAFFVYVFFDTNEILPNQPTHLPSQKTSP
jgi:hypothetical protein